MDGKSLISQRGRKNSLLSFLTGNDGNSLYYVFDFKEIMEIDILNELEEVKISAHSQLLRFDLFFLSLSLKGQFDMNINLSACTLRENDVLFYAPSSIHETKHYSDDYEALCIGIAPVLFQRIGLRLTGKTMMDLFPVIGNHVLQAAKDQLEVLLFLLRKLRALSDNPSRYYHHKELTFHYLLTLVYTLIDMRGRQLQQTNNDKFSRKVELRTQFLDMLMKHFKEERSVQFYANQLYVTPKYLSEAIKRLTGKTAGQVIDETVVLEAKILLSQSGITVKEVSESLNFSDASFFAKFFKRYTGLAPSDYRVSG